ncbi:MAG: hypothetical protein IKH59_00530 [Bacteroidaceae bacterium]|nr:hypothetical protein [Bacteroidaceae bacterium]
MRRIFGFHPTFSRRGRIGISSIWLIWLNKNVLLLLSVLMLAACREKGEDEFVLQGAWLLRQTVFPYNDEKRDFSAEGGGTLCIIYEGDSVAFECRLATTSTGMVIMPTAKATITLIDKGGGERLYLEDGNPHPLQISHEGDSLSSQTLLTIQRNGIVYTYERTDKLYREWGNEICDIITREADDPVNSTASHYVLSTRERQQERKILWYGYLLALGMLVILAVAHFAIVGHRAKRQLQLQLQQIMEVQENRSQGVKEAVKTVEKEFFTSDAYVHLRQRITSGQRLKEPDWVDIEERLKTVYPGFTSQLRSLYPMSELEYQVCLLIKLRIPPSDIAAVLSRDVSTISTVRSRLYKKVFGQKGGTREWDDFILSMGT